MPPTAPAPGSPDAAEPQVSAASLPNGVNAFSLRATGGVTTSLLRSGNALGIAGGCSGTTPLSLGFQSGSATGTDWMSFAFDTAATVRPGQTGVFPVEVRWDHGMVETRVPGGTVVLTPNRFNGSGTLTVTTHLATASARRLAGTVRGSVGNQAGERADVVADFSVNLSCGIGR